jgi:hypothetical protein
MCEFFLVFSSRYTHFRTLGFEVHNKLRLEVTPIRSHVKQGSEIMLSATVLAPQALPGVKLTVRIRSPSGK